MNNIGALLCWSWTFLRSVAGYVGVVFVWGGVLRGGGWGCLFVVFQGCFAGVGGGGGGQWALDYHSMGSVHFPNIS